MSKPIFYPLRKRMIAQAGELNSKLVLKTIFLWPDKHGRPINDNYDIRYASITLKAPKMPVSRKGRVQVEAMQDIVRSL